MRARRFLYVGLMGLVAACGQDRVSSGADLFAANCAVCHGADARGGGGAGVEGLSKIPPDLTVLSLGNGGVFPARDLLSVLETYSEDGQHAPNLAAIPALRDDDYARLRAGGVRMHTSRARAALIDYLASVQRP